MVKTQIAVRGRQTVSFLNSPKFQKYSKNAFSLAEALIALLIGSLILGMSAPLITKQLKHNNFSDVQAQVLNTKINSVNDKSEQNENNIAQNATNISTIKSQISSINSVLNNKNIQNVINGKNTQKNYDSDISSLQTKDTQLETNIKSVNNKLTSVDNDLAILEEDVTELEDNIKNIVPSGAVMYFDLTDCPKGWTALSSKYPKAANAFIRNLSGSGRTIGAWQQNAAPEIQGTFDGNVNDNNGAKTGAFYRISEENFGADGNYAGGKVGFKASKSSSVYGRNGATEVRPDNIVLLACRKN